MVLPTTWAETKESRRPHSTGRAAFLQPRRSFAALIPFGGRRRTLLGPLRSIIAGIKTVTCDVTAYMCPRPALVVRDPAGPGTWPPGERQVDDGGFPQPPCGSASGRVLMFRFSPFRNRRFVSRPIQGPLMMRVGLYWVLYHVVLWHALLVYRYVQHRISGGAGQTPVSFGEQFGQ